MKLTVFLSLLLVASMAKSQISYPPTSATPSGPAGGNLSGTYPNPTVVKINGTALSGLATGLLKNTTATGVPSIAVAGTDLIGGVGNLTTVGSVPYVSASGTLNQDAGQLHWDATNNRLGIGTNAPGNTLTVVGSGAAIRITGTNNTSAAYFQFNSSASTGLGYAGVEGSTPGATLTGTLAYATFISAGSSGSALQLGTPGGIRATILASGNVGIGTTAPSLALDVLGSARVYNSAADAAILIGSDQVDANSGKISYNRGTANLDITPRSTYATNLIGRLKFSITNSTGAGSALLGANSPALTLIAPYTWITVTTSDGSTGYMPIWR